MPLHPDYPIVEGLYHATAEWSISLPLQFNRRIEDGSLVLWRPGITAWIAVWGNDKSETAAQRLARSKMGTTKGAYDQREWVKDGRLFYSYRLNEPATDKRQPTLTCLVFGNTGEVQMSVYFDSERDAKYALAMCQGWVERAGA